MQNFGSRWLIILRGKMEDIEETFNSFYNLGGANSKIDITENCDNTIGVFWSNLENITHYWQNRFLLQNASIHYQKVYAGKNKDANMYVNNQIIEMKNNQEIFMTFDNKYITESHQILSDRAEKNDFNFKEQAIAHFSKA